VISTMRELIAGTLFCCVVTSTILGAIAFWGVTDENLFARHDLAGPACMASFSRCEASPSLPARSRHERR
jgi:hypothetical protein